MVNRAKDWFKQAERDLEQAKKSQENELYEWACFAAQQSAEKAVKAWHFSIGQEAWGHVVAKLLREIPPTYSVPEELIQKAQILDGFYIPPRYPNGFPEGAPFEHYNRLHSEQAIKYAGEILEFIRSRLAE
ncbi:MAG: HEPN domain-containing protein [Anaerolineales bacterium]